MKNSPGRFFFLAIGLLGILPVFSGCDPAGGKPAENGAAVASSGPTRLKMLVVDDPALASETHRRWSAEGRFDLVVETCTEQEIRDRNFVVAADIDLIVMPADLEPEFMTAGQLVEIPSNNMESPGFSQAGLLPQFRGNLGTISDRNYSFPLGAPQAMLLVHDSLARREGFSAQSWDSVNQGLAAAGDVDKPAEKMVYPDSGDWLAWSLLARAASTVRASDDRSVLFVVETMEPLIDSPGFVDALEKMRDGAAPLDPQNPRTPGDVFRMVAGGKAMAGLGWPSALENSDNPIEAAGSVYTYRLPGSARRYNRKRDEWVERKPTEQQQFDLFGVDGRCVGVTTASLYAGTSMELAIWMSNQSSAVICPRSVASGPFRKSHLINPNTWIGIPMTPDAELQWASEIEASHAALLPVVFPPLAGRDEYLNVLTGAVRSCLANEKSAEDALRETATAWSAITEKHGIEVQKARIRWRKP